MTELLWGLFPRSSEMTDKQPDPLQWVREQVEKLRPFESRELRAIAAVLHDKGAKGLAKSINEYATALQKREELFRNLAPALLEVAEENQESYKNCTTTIQCAEAHERLIAQIAALMPKEEDDD